MELDPKEVAAREAVLRIRNGMVVGIGSGTTVDRVIRMLSAQVADGLKVRLAMASLRSEAAARALGLQPEDPSELPALDLVIDGADEFDPQLNLIKGGGGALVREKLLARMANEFLVVVDPTKRVQQLGHFPVPVAILPFAAANTLDRLRGRGFALTVRQGVAGRYLTDDGLWIADLHCGPIGDPAALERDLKSETGVVEVGLFSGMADRVIIGYADGHTEEVQRPSLG